jgi:hypothetical protein
VGAGSEMTKTMLAASIILPSTAAGMLARAVMWKQEVK